MQPLRWAIAVAALTLGPKCAFAQPAEDESAGYTVETVLGGLDNPWGLAIRAGRDKAGPHELFLAESGAGRVIRISTNQPDKVHKAIAGFSVGASTTIPDIRVGPLGLAFLTRTKLIVAGSDGETGKREVRVYALPGDDSTHLNLAADHWPGGELAPGGVRTRRLVHSAGLRPRL